LTPDEPADRIRLEYLEMPDLKLTLPQVRRLCDLPQDACESAVEALLSVGFLQQSDTGRFLLGPGRQNAF
jgi:DNA-binding IclR family transcriptional regulator